MKRFLSAFLCALSLVLCFASCGKSEKFYFPAELKCYDSEGLIYTVSYEYDENGNILSQSGIYERYPARNYCDTYTYKNGKIVSLKKETEFETAEYTAEKITKYKYLFTSGSGETITLIFDLKGHIVSNKTSDGFVSEFAYTYDKSGKPVNIKQQIINPSGSSKIYDYTVEFQNKDTYKYYEKQDSSYYYIVKCDIKE